MSRYDFRTWLTNLRAGVDYVPIANVRKVERIIMLDPSITYENLRQVSTLLSPSPFLRARPRI